jgi:hypothetical protein
LTFLIRTNSQQRSLDSKAGRAYLSSRLHVVRRVSGRATTARGCSAAWQACTAQDYAESYEIKLYLRKARASPNRTIMVRDCPVTNVLGGHRRAAANADTDFRICDQLIRNKMGERACKWRISQVGANAIFAIDFPRQRVGGGSRAMHDGPRQRCRRDGWRKWTKKQFKGDQFIPMVTHLMFDA